VLSSVPTLPSRDRSVRLQGGGSDTAEGRSGRWLSRRLHDLPALGSPCRPHSSAAGSRGNRRRQRAPRSSARLVIAPIRRPGHQAIKAWAGVEDRGPVHLAAPEGTTISIRLSKTASPSASRAARPPTDRSLLRPAGATQQTCSVFAVSHRPDGSRHLSLAGLLQPAANHEVHWVSALSIRVPTVDPGLLTSAHPPEPSPACQPPSRHRADLPSRRSPSRGIDATSGP
jgi:hypothetical protein